MPPQIQKTCNGCGKTFLVYPYRAMSAKTCSYKCAGLTTRSKVNRTCRNCGSSFLISPSQFRYYQGAGKYCSQPCAYEGMVKNNADKPIKDKYGRSGRKVDQDWKKAVREKDQNTCQRCGVVEKYIHTHHVAPISRRPDLRLEISNGKCLCNSCHSWVHGHPREATEMGLLSDASYEKARKEDYWRKADNVMITHNGETKCASEWAKVTPFTAQTIRRRWHLGWEPAAILTRPLRIRT